MTTTTTPTTITASIIVSSKNWAIQFVLSRKTFTYVEDLIHCRINILSEGKGPLFENIYGKRSGRVGLDSLFDKVLNFVEKKGIHLSPSKIRKLYTAILSLQENEAE